MERDWYESDPDYTGWVLISDKWRWEPWYERAYYWLLMRFPTRYRRARLVTQMVMSISVAAWHATHDPMMFGGEIGKVVGVRFVESGPEGV
jgi:hypothetical protein